MTIPNSLTDPITNENEAVTGIAQSAFSVNYNITIIVIPNSVTTIGAWAFEDCHSLQSATLPNTITSMGNSAFYGDGALTTVNIPTGISEILNSTFCDCGQLTHITIPSNITIIDNSSFAGCSDLQGVTIPASVTEIGEYAFAGESYAPSQLSVAIFLGNAPTMDSSAFNYCAPDFKVYYPSAATGYTAVTWEGYPSQSYDPTDTYTVTYDSNGGTGSAPTDVTGLAMGGSVPSLAGQGTMLNSGYEFKGWNTAANGSGTNYNVGDSLFATGNTTLYANWTHTYSVTTNSTTNGTISASVTEAEQGDFVTVTVTPDAGYRLKYDSLIYNDGTSDNVISMSEGKEDEIDNDGPDGPDAPEYYFTMPADNVTISATFESTSNDYDIDDSTGEITRYYGTGGNITIPSTIDGVDVTSIGDDVFYPCNDLTSVVIPEGVTSIGDSAFEYCENLESVSFPQSLTTIGEYAFADTGLVVIRIPANVAEIDECAFADGCIAFAIFDGNAPTHFGDGVFDGNDDSFQILYHTANTGFLSGLDDLYTCNVIEDMDSTDLDALYLTFPIVYAAADSPTSVKSNLYLPTTAIDGSAITWSSDTLGVISDSGVVSRPAAGAADADVKLTATLADGNSNTYDLTVPAQDCTVTFMNGTSTYDTETEAYNDSVGDDFPEAPTKSGYTFEGWFTGANGAGAKVTSSTIVTADMTVYADWTSNSSSGGDSSAQWQYNDNCHSDRRADSADYRPFKCKTLLLRRRYRSIDRHGRDL